MPRAIFLGDYEASALGRTRILACQALRSVEWPSQSCWIDRIINAFCPKQSHWYFLKTIRMGGKCDPYGFESLTLKIVKIEIFFFLEKFHSQGAFSGSLINCLEFCCSPQNTHVQAHICCTCMHSPLTLRGRHWEMQPITYHLFPRQGGLVATEGTFEHWVVNEVDLVQLFRIKSSIQLWSSSGQAP